MLLQIKQETLTIWYLQEYKLTEHGKGTHNGLETILAAFVGATFGGATEAQAHAAARAAADTGTF